MKTSSPKLFSSLWQLITSAVCWLALVSTARSQGTNPLRIICPPDQTNWICGVSSTALVTYPAPTTTGGNCSSAPSIACSSPSGALFILGVTTVTCTATNRCGERDSCTFRVTVARDTIPPVIQCSSNVIVTLCGTAATVPVNYPKPTATDNADPNVAVACSPTPGSQFPVGTTMITCTATDDCTNRATCTFTVTVLRDTTPPVIECPSNIVLWTCSTNAIAHYNVTATDDHDTNVTVACTPPAGTPLPVGVTTINCVARDDCGNLSRCSFLVTVRQDTQAPRIHCPSNLVVYATSGQGAVVNFKVTATDDGPYPVSVVCDPPSGSLFRMGVTPVDCESTDACGFVGVCSFEVEVRIPKLDIQLRREGMIVAWPGDAGLEVADSLEGPWQAVRGARSPYLVGAAAVGQQFFRPLGFKAAEFEPTHRVEGRIRFNYVRRGPDLLASTGNADYPQYAGVHTSIDTRAIRRAKVVLQDDQGHYIKGKLDEDGDYSFEWNPAIGQNGQITVFTVSHYGGRNAAVGRWVGPPITSTDELTSNTGDYRPFSYSQSFSLADARIANGGLDLNITIPETDESAQAFWILENGLVALDYYLGLGGVDIMPKLNITFTPELPLDGGSTAFYSPGKNPGFIFMPHDFGWIDFAVRHEAAHCFQYHYMRSGITSADGYWLLAEPLANVHALAMIGSSWMDKITSFEDVDVQANFAEDAFRLEASNDTYWNYCTDCTGLDFKTGWPQRVLWDLLDGHQDDESEPLTTYYPFQSDEEFDAGEFDLIDGGASASTQASAHLLNDVLLHYLGGGVYGQESPHFQSRGATAGMDIVEVLDGFLCRGHATTEQIDRLINHAMMFGYPLDAPTDCD